MTEPEDDDGEDDFVTPPNLASEVRSVLKVAPGADRASVDYVAAQAAAQGISGVQALREWLARKQIQADRSGFVKPASRFEGANDTQLVSLVKYLRYAASVQTNIPR